MKPFALAIGALLLPAVGAHRAQAQQLAQQPAPHVQLSLDRLVAVVGDQPITWYDLQERINVQRRSGARPPSDTTGMRAAARDVLNSMIDEELLLQKAKALKVEIPDADLNAQVDRQFKAVRARFQTEQEFRQQLALAGLGSPEEYRKFLTDQTRRNELQSRVVAKLREDGKLVSENITDADVQEAFDRNKASLGKRPASVTLRQIVLNPQPSQKELDIARAKAESILVDLKKGADFALLAKRESMDPGSKDIGGDLGWHRRGELVPEFEQWIFPPYGLAPGQLSPVVRSPFGFHIIRVDRIQPGQVKSSHILIRPTVDSADVARNVTLADSVAAALRSGTKFDTLARRYHDYANKEETNLLTPIPIDSMPQQYQDALRNAKPNDVVVFQIPGRPGDQPKEVVAQLLTHQPEGDYTLAELRERIRDQLKEEGAIHRLLLGLRKDTFVSMRLDEVPATELEQAFATGTAP